MTTEQENALARLARCAVDLAVAFEKLNAETQQARKAADALRVFMLSKAFRCAKRDYNNGYASPSWVHEVWEQQREQFGTGNGRVERKGWGE